jgi:DNA polymerase III alpha subunit
VAGQVRTLKIVATGDGPMSFLTLEDSTGEAEVVVGSRLYETRSALLQERSLIVLRVRWSERNGTRRLQALEVESLARSGGGPSSCWIELPLDLATRDHVAHLGGILADHPGPVLARLRVRDGDRALIVEAGPRYTVQPCSELKHRLVQLGPGVRVEWE